MRRGLGSGVQKIKRYRFGNWQETNKDATIEEMGGFLWPLKTVISLEIMIFCIGVGIRFLDKKTIRALSFKKKDI